MDVNRAWGEGGLEFRSLLIVPNYLQSIDFGQKYGSVPAHRYGSRLGLG